MENSYLRVIKELKKRLNLHKWVGYGYGSFEDEIEKCSEDLLYEVEELIKFGTNKDVTEYYIKINIFEGIKFEDNYLKQIDKIEENFQKKITNKKINDVEETKFNEWFYEFQNEIIWKIEDIPYQLTLLLLTYFPLNQHDSEIINYVNRKVNDSNFMELLKNNASILYQNVINPKKVELTPRQIWIMEYIEKGVLKMPDNIDNTTVYEEMIKKYGGKKDRFRKGFYGANEIIDNKKDFSVKQIEVIGSLLKEIKTYYLSIGEIGFANSERLLKLEKKYL